MLCIFGQNYHRIGSLFPVDGTMPMRFAQLYIYDTENEVSNRVQFLISSRRQAEIDIDIFHALIEMFYKTNVIVKAFWMAKGRFSNSDVQPVKLRLLGYRFNRQYFDVVCFKIDGSLWGMLMCLSICVVLLSSISHMVYKE